LKVVESQPHLLILDLSLPDEDGLSVCRKLRQKWNFPILMLTSRGDLMDKVIGLEVGADDYLTKPFEVRELVARIRSCLRRVEEYQAPETAQNAVEIGNLVLDRKARRVHVDGNPITLTATEFKLLEYFVVNRDQILEREQLFEQVWGYDESFNTNSLEVFVYRLRSKVEKASGQKLFHTVRGLGYRFGLNS
jgi:two-component system, OmpR family, response regulator VicR